MSPTVHGTYSRKRTRCETAPHSFKAAGGDDWLKRNIHHETPCILLSSMKVNMCVHQRVQCMTVLYKTTGGLLRNKTEVHTALLPTYRRRWTDIVLMLGQCLRRWANIITTFFSVRVNMTSQRRRPQASIKTTVVSVESLLLALPPSAYINTYLMDYSCRPTHQTQRILNNLG